MIAVISERRLAQAIHAFKMSEAEFFRSLRPESLEWVRGVVHPRKLYPRRRLFSEGESADHLWVVQAGRLRLLKSDAKGKVTTLESLGPGEMFGMWSPDPAELYAATAEAMTDGSVWRLSKAVVTKLIDQEPGLGAEMVRVIPGRLRDAHERLHSFAYEAVPARLARAVLRAAEGSEANVTRRILAESCGTTVETTIRVLRRFEKEGLVVGTVGSIRVLDPKGLAEIAGDSPAE